MERTGSTWNGGDAPSLEFTVNGPRERLRQENRLRSSIDFAFVKHSGHAFRGAHCLVLAAPRPGEPTRFGFVASRRAVGNAVQRNRARRRLREIVRRRWPRIPAEGHWIMVIAHRGAVTAPHQELASELEHLLASCGAIAPIGAGGSH